MKKSMLSLLLALCLLAALVPTPAWAAEEISISFNGKDVSGYDVYYDENGRTMVPYTLIAALLDAEEVQNVQLDRGDDVSVAQQGVIIAKTAENAVLLMEDSYDMDYGALLQEQGAVSGSIRMESCAVYKDGMLYVPLRFVLEYFGYTVTWDAQTQHISIASPSSAFDFALLDYMPQDKNYMVSPISLKLALAMAANGAAGETLQEMLDVLDILDLDRYNEEVKSFIETLNANEWVEFNVANSIWLNTDCYKDVSAANNPRFTDAFAGIIENSFQGVADEVTNGTGAEQINDWIAEQTKDKIKDVVSDENVEDNLSILVNTIYFKGAWASPFSAGGTHDAVFTDRNGVESSTAFMNDTDYYSYYSGAEFSMLAKPYQDGNIRMYFILPESDEPLTQAAFDTALAEMTRENVRFSVPKFKTEFTHTKLKDILKDMGICRAFSDALAEFPSMVEGIPDLAISDVLQKTFIEVDEEGTEAAAATVVMMVPTSLPMFEEPISFTCDRPFTYIIRDDSSGTILFMGEYAFVE